MLHTKKMDTEDTTTFSPDDIFALNIGGERCIEVQRRTFLAATGTLLEAMFRGTWGVTSLRRDAAGKVFIDQPPELFLPLVNYLRALRDEQPNHDHHYGSAELRPPRARPPTHLGASFDIMLEYYQMTMVVFRLELRVLSMPPPSDDNLSISNNFQNNGQWVIESPNDWVTVDLHRIHHGRKILKFTVVMGEFTHARIGWRDLDRIYPVHDANPPNKEPGSYCNPSKGVGDFLGTIGFDCQEDLYDSLYVDGQDSTSSGFSRSYPLAGLNFAQVDKIQPGIKIECYLTQPTEQANLFRGAVRPIWAINGTFTDSFVTYSWSPRDAVPCISLQGSLLIQDVIYETIA